MYALGGESRETTTQTHPSPAPKCFPSRFRVLVCAAVAALGSEKNIMLNKSKLVHAHVHVRMRASARVNAFNSHEILRK